MSVQSLKSDDNKTPNTEKLCRKKLKAIAEIRKI